MTPVRRPPCILFFAITSLHCVRANGVYTDAVSGPGPFSASPDCLSENRVYELVRGRLSDTAANEIERHADGCPGCRSLIVCVRQDQGPNEEGATPANAPPAAEGAELR